MAVDAGYNPTPEARPSKSTPPPECPVHYRCPACGGLRRFDAHQGAAVCFGPPADRHEGTWMEPGRRVVTEVAL